MAITIGILELRQHAHRYLRRVRAGETITLTDRGVPFAEIRPLQPPGDAIDRLIAGGRVRPARSESTEFLDEHPSSPVEPGERPLAEVVFEIRADELP